MEEENMDQEREVEKLGNGDKQYHPLADDEQEKNVEKTCPALVEVSWCCRGCSLSMYVNISRLGLHLGLIKMEMEKLLNQTKSEKLKMEERACELERIVWIQPNTPHYLYGGFMLFIFWIFLN
jgi:hypothetical protein